MPNRIHINRNYIPNSLNTNPPTSAHAVNFTALKTDIYTSSKVGLKSSELAEKLQKFRGKVSIIFSDIDGTLSHCDDKITPETLKFANILSQKNIPLILTTARTYEDTLPIIEQFSPKPLFTIALQGGSIHDKNGNAIVKNIISKLEGEKLIKWHKQTFSPTDKTHLIMYFNGDPYCASDIQYPWKSRTLITKVDNFSELLDKKEFQKAVLYRTLSTKDETNLINETFRTYGINDLDVKTSNPQIYEIQNKNISKEKAIKIILQHLNIPPQKTMTIGDSANDISMLDFARKNGGLAVAMDNATSDVKNHANAVTLCVTEDGFAEVVKNII